MHRFIHCLSAFVLAATSQAAPVTLSVTSSPEMTLGTETSVTLTVTGEPGESVDLSVDAANLYAQCGCERDLEFQIAPTRTALPPSGTATATLRIRARTSAPSFKEAPFDIMARSASAGTVKATARLTIEPTYIVDISRAASGAYEFSSQSDTAYFRAHAGGLALVFRNKTSEPVIIHGSGAIQHQDTSDPIAPGATYSKLPRIPPSPEDFKGSYTIHTVYQPTREAVFNATKVPAPKP